MPRCCLLLVVLFCAVLGAQSSTQRLRWPFVGRVLQADGTSAAEVVVTARWRIAPELPGLVGWQLGEADALGTSQLEVETDQRGRFRLDLPTKGPVTLVARSRDGALQSLRTFPVMAGGFVEVSLRPAAFYGGRVLGDDGQPWANCELAFEPDRQTWSRLAVGGLPIARERFRATADGTFRHAIEHAYLSTPQWEPFVSLRASNGARRFRGPTVVRPLAGSDNQDFVPVEARQLSGRVRDERGHTVAGARVYVRRVPWNVVRTDRDGAFTIAAVRARDLAVRVGHRDQALVENDFADGVVDVSLDPKCSMECRLLAANGDALAGCEVLWATVRGDEPPAVAHGRTDASGRFAFDGVSNFETTSAYVRVDGCWRRFWHRRQRTAVDLGELRVSWRKLGGQLVDIDGAPVAGARVVAMDTEVPEDVSPCCWVTYTDHGGRFTFPSLPRVGLRVMVEASTRGFAHTVVDKQATECRIAFERRAQLQVNVAGPGGDPGVGSWVLMVASGGLELGDAPSPSFGSTSVIGICDANGQVRFRGLPNRTWRVMASCLHAGTVAVGQTNVTSGKDDVVDVRLRGR